MNDSLLDELRAYVGMGNVLTSNEDTSAYLTDWRRAYTGKVRCVVTPASAHELSAAVRCCHRHRVPMVPQGGNTGLVGGATPHAHGQEVLFCFHRMNQVRSIDPVNNSIVVDSGCTLSQVQRAALTCQRIFPLTLASQDLCQIGGNISTNAGGVNVLRFGSMRELTLGLEVVLPDGQVWNGLTQLYKNNVGYDLKQLFIGAEGTLGLITAASLRLFVQPKKVMDVWMTFPDLQGVLATFDFVSTCYGPRLNSFELISAKALDLTLHHIPDVNFPLSSNAAWHVLMEVSDTFADIDLETSLQQHIKQAQARGQMSEVVVAHTVEEKKNLWRLRLNLSEAQRREGPSIKHDIALPISFIPEFLSDIEARLTVCLPRPRMIVFGHMGDGNLHFNLSISEGMTAEEFAKRAPSVQQLVHERVIQLGGTISAEHGIGRVKIAEVQSFQGPLEIQMRRNLKQMLDPLGLMNPGKAI